MTPSEMCSTAFWALKQKRIKTGSASSTRASSIGNECDMFLFLERTAGDKRAPHTPQLQAIFDLGRYLETYVIRELEEAGIEVVQRGRDWYDERLQIRGMVDAALRFPDSREVIPTEIKGLNPYTAERVETLEDIRNSRSPWVRKYYAQLQTYLFLEGKPLGMFAILDKSGGGMVFIDCPIDLEYTEVLLKRAERVRDAVASKTPPAKRITSDCPRCPFVHVCAPDITYGPGVQVLDDEELLCALKRREELAAAAAEYEALDKQVKKSLPRAAEALCGGFVIRGKEVERKAYEVKAGSYWKFTIEKAPEAPGGSNAG